MNGLPLISTTNKTFYILMKYFNASLTMYTIPIIKKTIKTIARPPQKGIVTHHQDQSITLHNFNTTKQTPNNPVTPIPESLTLLIILYLVVKNLFLYSFA